MLVFCPTCGNVLLVETHHGSMRMCCQVCPYIYAINKKVTMSALLKQKEVDDVLGDEETWKHAQKTDMTCPECTHPTAYFMEIQTRSADEPATLFFQCCSCSHRWKMG